MSPLKVSVRWSSTNAGLALWSYGLVAAFRTVIVHHPRIRRFLDGLTAGVVGLIAGTTVALLKVSVTSLEFLILFALALTVLFLSNARMAIPAVIAAAALWGLLARG